MPEIAELHAFKEKVEKFIAGKVFNGLLCFLLFYFHFNIFEGVKFLSSPTSSCPHFSLPPPPLSLSCDVRGKGIIFDGTCFRFYHMS